MPWSNFQGHSHWSFVRWIPFQDASLKRRSLFDLVLNLFLYAPVGYFYMPLCRAVSTAAFLRVILMAGLLSVATELFQVFSHNRIPSMTDVLMNIIGTAVGAIAAIIWGANETNGMGKGQAIEKPGSDPHNSGLLRC